MKTKILITGAAGAVGYATLQELLKTEDQYQITAFDIPGRTSKKLLSPLKSKIEVIYGDILDKTKVEGVVKNKDFVIHLAAIIPPAADENEELAYNVNRNGTEILVNALEKHSPNAFLLYSSSVAVYGDRFKTPCIKVGDPLENQGQDAYTHSKIEAEKIVKNSKLAWSIFRFGAVFGLKNHKTSGLLFRMPLETVFEFITLEDTGRAVAKAVEKNEVLKNQIFNLSGGESCRVVYKDIMSKTFAIAGLGAFKFPENAFAEKNFHCGYFEDAGQLQDLLNFQKDDYQSYLKMMKDGTPALQRMIVSLIRKPIKAYLLKMSEPYQAYRSGDKEKMAYFFEG